MQKPAGLPDNKRLRSFLHFYDHLKGHPELAIALATVAISTITTSILLNRDPLSLFYYSDGPSHLVIARRVVDWIDPGLAQLGSVWLPITHLMLLPFVLNDFLFKTGLAGTFVSTISTAIAAVLLFRIVKFQFNSVGGGLLASALYLLNPIVMYMGVLPMMEAPFNMFFLLFAYYGIGVTIEIEITFGNIRDK